MTRPTVRPNGAPVLGDGGAPHAHHSIKFDGAPHGAGPDGAPHRI